MPIIKSTIFRALYVYNFVTKISSHFTDKDFYLSTTFNEATFVLELIINLLDKYFALLVIFSKRPLITVNGDIAKRQATAPAAAPEAVAQGAAEGAAVEVTLPEAGAGTQEAEDTREEVEDTREEEEDTPQEEEVAEEVAVEEVRRLSERSRKCE